jgi:dihydroxyacetone kinase-like protein
MMQTAATGFLDAVGASTGPLYATGFRRAAQVLAGRNELDLASLP